MSLRDFALHTNLSTFSISDMEAKGERAKLRHSTQKLLDDTLATAAEDTRLRFCALLGPTVLRANETTAAREPVSHSQASTEGSGGATDSPRSTSPDGIPAEVPDVLAHRRGPDAGENDEVNRRDVLADGGTIAAGVTLFVPTRVADALSVVTLDNADRLAAALDHLDELIRHYSDTVCRVPSPTLYDEVLSLRSFVGSQLAGLAQGSTHRSDLTVASGWLSNLLAVVASYLDDHATALVWCIDAERRSLEVGHPELAGWATLTRAMIAYYQGQTHRSVTLAASGRQATPIGSVIHAKLAAQEMRARAMLGDAREIAQAQHRAATAIAALPADAPTTGVFSIPLSQDPPYTATSLLLIGEYEQAAAATDRVLDTVYHGPAHHPGKQTSNYARTLLIMGLALAGLSRAAEAAAAGQAALSAARPVWPTMVLAGKLDQVLTRSFNGVTEVRDYHHLYTDTAVDSSGPRPQPSAVPEDRG
jgi:hypothetical protein